nr:reverse transcriptase domain-containing protein [Tanacetum cinerariifolium]
MIDLGSFNYFLEISVARDSSRMFLSQRKYATEILEQARMVGCNSFRTPIETESKLGDDGDPISDPTLYRSLASFLLYLTFTRADISYATQHVCLHMHDLKEPHFSALKRVLRYVSVTLDYGLQLFSSFTTSLVAYSDADWAGCPTNRRSTLEAEYRGVANVVVESCWLMNLLRELHTPLSPAMLVYCDNVSVVYLSFNPVQHQCTKHKEIDIHFVRDLVATRQGSETWYSTSISRGYMMTYSMDWSDPHTIMGFVADNGPRRMVTDTRNHFEKMSAMANTTPIVTTVTKTATKEKALNEAETAPRINILDFLEAVLTNETLLLAEIVLEAEAAPMALKNRKAIPIPLTEQETNIGQLRLLVTVADADHSIRAWINFMIVRSLLPYNGIIGRPGIKEIHTVPSTTHGMLKFPSDGGIVTIRSTILIPAERKGQALERTKAIQAEVQKLVEAGIIREVYYHNWLSNPVMKSTGRLNLSAATPLSVSWTLTKAITKYSWQSRIRKTAFHTGQGLYCYTKMPFDLKNAGATYQRLVDKAFDSQIGRNIEVSVDDLVIKSHTEAEMLRDISETFRTLRKINMKLNPKKSTFGAAKGMFLVYMISSEGIKPWPNKTEVVLQLPSPRTTKEVQSLNEKLASLNRFLSKSVEKSLQLFKTLKKCIKKSDFHWTSKAEQAFKHLKQHLSELPMLVAPKLKEELIVYLSASHGDISVVFDDRERHSLDATRRLQRYFQAHPITIITDQPIKQIMSRPDMAGRLQKKSVMLGEHNITYRPRTSVKGQILADILADFLAEMPDESLPDASVVETLQEPWTLFTDRSSSDYEAPIAGLRIIAQIGVRNVHVSVDSKLIANQVLGAYVTKEENMIKYLEKVKSLVNGFANFSINQVPRSKNKKADALSKIASTNFAHLTKQVLVEILKEKSIQEKEVTTLVEEDGPTWMTPIIEYLNEGTLLGDRKEASKLHIKDQQSCSMHAGPWSVVAKGIRLGYYWPTMHRDTRDMIRACNDCQIHRPGKVKFLIVVMDYFTKWIEAKSVATITGNQVKQFVWDNIVCCFGLLGEIVSDNGKQFSDNSFKDWYEKLNITQRFASVKHSQSNGLVERANRSLGKEIKARLGEGNKNWIEELPHVLWTHRIMIKSSNSDTPFSLTYRTEAVIPAEIRMPTYRTATVDAVHNDKELRLNLDLLEERYECVVIREAKAKLKMTKGREARSEMEGPYEVTKALGYGAYKLRSTNRTVLPRTWNVANLKKCYP